MIEYLEVSPLLLAGIMSAVAYLSYTIGTRKGAADHAAIIDSTIVYLISKGYIKSYIEDGEVCLEKLDEDNESE